MSVLSGPMIAATVDRTRRMRENRLKEGYGWPPAPTEPHGPLIDIEPFDPSAVGPNSYDLRLAPELRRYEFPQVCDVNGVRGELRHYLDMRDKNETLALTIPDDGMVLFPGEFYLATTIEKTACAGVVPWIDGRSSVGRLGINIHATAGRGDDGFGMHRPGGCEWTLEITVSRPVRIYPLVRIAQITFMRLEGERKPYKGRYSNQTGPTASEMWRDFVPKTPEE